MYLDESPIFPNDLVYDIIYGQGKVEKILPLENKVLVSFGQRTMGYRNDGSGPFSVRTLYWHNPIMGAPPKDEKAFEFYRTLCVTLGGFCAEQRNVINKLLEVNNGASSQ